MIQITLIEPKIEYLFMYYLAKIKAVNNCIKKS